MERTAAKPASRRASTPRRSGAIAGLVLFATTLALYGRVASYEFIAYDDSAYVYKNSHVLDGLTVDGLHWAFGTYAMSNWHPVTWLSHMADAQFFGTWPGGHHLTSAFLHALATVFLFAALLRMTAERWASALVAALFALHPLRVESVAWIAERKDVLSGLFFFVALWFYALYVEKARLRYLGAVAAAYVLGLMAKPMIVTLPVVLLLLDFWPLGRFGRDFGRPATWSRPLLEKVPLFALAAASSFVTVRAMTAFVGLEALPLATRLAHAARSYLAYIGMIVWPHDLSVFYPHPYGFDGRDVAAVGFLLLLTSFALLSARRRPYLAIGWLWYLVTLVPVIGIVQVGEHGMADRYTYLPSVGVMIAFVWAAREGAARWRVPPWTRTVAAMVVLAALSLATWRQLGLWRDTETLFTHALAVMPENSTAHAVLGSLLLNQDRLPEAEEHFRAAVRVDPGYARAHYFLALTLLQQGESEEALAHHALSVEYDPGNATFHAVYGYALQEAGRFEEAASQHRAALAIRPGDAVIHYNLGIVYAALGRLESAIQQFDESARIDPTDPDPHLRLATLLDAQGNFDGARQHYLEALKLDPANREAKDGLAEISKATTEIR